MPVAHHGGRAEGEDPDESGLMRGMFIQLRNMLGKEENWGLCTGSRWFPMENVMKRWMQ